MLQIYALDHSSPALFCLLLLYSTLGLAHNLASGLIVRALLASQRLSIRPGGHILEHRQDGQKPAGHVLSQDERVHQPLSKLLEALILRRNG